AGRDAHAGQSDVHAKRAVGGVADADRARRESEVGRSIDRGEAQHRQRFRSNDHRDDCGRRGPPARGVRWQAPLRGQPILGSGSGDGQRWQVAPPLQQRPSDPDVRPSSSLGRGRRSDRREAWEATMRPSSFRLLASSLAVLLLAAACSLRTSAPPTTAEVAERLNHLAVPFVENAGQSDPRVAYYAPTFAGTVFVTGEGEVVYAVPAPEDRAPAAGSRDSASGWTLAERVRDGHPTAGGAHPAATHLSVFAGDDPARWQPDVASYGDVDLGTVWPGISVRLSAYGKQVEKVFTVEPGAVPDTIRVRVAGAQGLAVAADGALVAHTGVGDVRLTPPAAYQEIGGTRRMGPAAYEIAGDEYGFRVRDYDPTRPVVIDPLLQATFLGGSDVDQAFGLAIAPTTGDVYVAGLTQSIDFP